MASVYEQEARLSGDQYYVALPKGWRGAEEGKLQLIVDDICVVIPPSIASATGELLVLRFIEAMIDAGIVDAGDVQKALEHLV